MHCYTTNLSYLLKKDGGDPDDQDALRKMEIGWQLNHYDVAVETQEDQVGDLNRKKYKEENILLIIVWTRTAIVKTIANLCEIYLKTDRKCL